MEQPFTINKRLYSRYIIAQRGIIQNKFIVLSAIYNGKGRTDVWLFVYKESASEKSGALCFYEHGKGNAGLLEIEYGTGIVFKFIEGAQGEALFQDGGEKV